MRSEEVGYRAQLTTIKEKIVIISKYVKYLITRFIKVTWSCLQTSLKREKV